MTTIQLCTWQEVTRSATIAKTVEKKLEESEVPVTPAEFRAIVAVYEAACDCALSKQCSVPGPSDFVYLVGNMIYSDTHEEDTTVYYEEDTTIDTVRDVVHSVPLGRIIDGVLAMTKVRDCCCYR